MIRLLLVSVGLLIGGVASATPPVLSYIYPAGGQRGTTVPVRVGGLFVHDRCGFALDGPGVRATPELHRGERIWFEGPIIPLPDSQQPEDYPVDMNGSVAVDAAAAIGARRCRVWTSQGAATGPVFVVGELPEVVEHEADGDPIPQPVTLPVTANGRIFPREDTDLWAVTLKKGQTLSALAGTTAIRSPVIAKLEVVNTAGQVLAEAGPHAVPGSDASVLFTAPVDGMYHVRISDVRGQGGPAFVYRLTLTTDPVVDAVFPLGGKRGEKVMLDGGFTVSIPADAPSVWSAHLRPAQTVLFDTDDLPEVNTPPAEPVVPPVIFNGRAGPSVAPGWKVKLSKSKQYDIEVRARKLGSPLCGTLVVLDPSGKEVARNVPADPGSDPVLHFQPGADGVYTLRVAERFRDRGPEAFAYRLRVREVTNPPADFRLKLATEVLNVPRGGTVKWKVDAERLGGFNGPIDLSVEGLPGGVTAAKATIAPGQSSVELALLARADAKVSVGPVTVTGAAKIGERSVKRTATLPENGTPVVAVAVPTPFVIDGEYTMSNAPRGQPYGRKYKLKRNGFEGPVEVRIADRQARHLQGVTSPTVVVPAGQSEFEYSAQLPAWIEIGRTCRVCIMATGTVKDPDGAEHRVSYTTTETNYQLIVVPEPGRLSIDLATSAAVAAPGETVRVPFQLSRAKGLTGEVRVGLVVPSHWHGITARYATVPADRSVGELVLEIGKDAPGPFNMPATVRATCGSVIAEAKLELLAPN